MGISQERKNEIHFEVRQELKRHLKTWGALFGITNLVALIGLGFYVFFFAPKNAVQEAKAQINNEIYALKENLLNQSSNALIEVGKIQGRIELIDENTDSLRIEYIKATELLNEIQSDISKLADADREELALIIERLEKYPDTKTLLSRISGLDIEVNEIKKRLICSTWETPSLAPNWSDYGSNFTPIGYYKDGIGVVHLRGLVKGGKINSLIFKLPSGYRPENKQMYNVITYDKVRNNTHKAGRIDIHSNGNVMFIAGGDSWVSLSVISFLAAK